VCHGKHKLLAVAQKNATLQHQLESENTANSRIQQQMRLANNKQCNWLSELPCKLAFP
jgi:hypothetical protein